jgi:flavin reductase (DIM6/NTAB) family NADH-FMN oxidoreductase RutF
MVDPEEFRKGLRAFTTGVTIVTIPHGDGGMHAMTASSFASVSLKPQLMAISIAKSAKAHPLILSAERYGINVLGEDQGLLANYFANRLDEWIEPDHEWVDGVPLLRGTMGSFSCRQWANYDGGDHTIFVSEALSLRRTDDAPLVCSRGRFHRLGERMSNVLPPKRDKTEEASGKTG